MMNGVTGANVNTQNYQMTFGNKMTKAQQEVLNVIEKNQEKIALERMRKEFPEEYKIVMQNRIMSAMRESINEIFSPKNLIKMEIDVIKENLAYGLAKLIGKCNRTLNKIPFVKNARDKKFAKFEETINQRFKDGVIDADQAGELLIKSNHKIKKV